MRQTDVRIESVLVRLQRRLIYFPFPAQVPRAKAVVAGAREVTLRTVDSLALGAWLVAPGGPDRGVAVLVANGNAGNRSLRAPLARALASAGLAVLLFDYRGYGGNPAARIAAPAELGEGVVEALREGRQHGLRVEVAGAHGLPAVLDRQKPSSVRKTSRAAAAISPWRRPSWGAAIRSRSRSSGESLVESGASTTGPASRGSTSRSVWVPKTRFPCESAHSQKGDRGSGTRDVRAGAD